MSDVPLTEPPDGAPFVVDLGDPAARDPALTGGKGASLARLVDAGFPVPAGCCVTTAVYRAVAADPDLAADVAALSSLDPTDADAIAAGAARVRERLRGRWLPAVVRLAVEDALAEMDAEAVAVRSSATAEDLPTASFAGQHETYLNVRGAPAVLDRLGDCLASLFTDRAVAYRLRNGVPHASVAMAVVVQAMVEPSVAGVLFTADPVSEHRRIASVDASYGLGDAVVAGAVTPDTARVDRRTGTVLEYIVGEKASVVRPAAGEAGGTETVAVEPARRTKRALTGGQLRTLVELGGRIEALLGVPQDVEWALVRGTGVGGPGSASEGGRCDRGGSGRAERDRLEGDDAADRFVVLQSRPITSLYPLVTPRPTDDALHVYLSFGHQQAMPAALPPLVVDFWRGFIDRAAGHFRGPKDDRPVGAEAGSRVYLDLTVLLRLRPLRPAVMGAIGALNEPAAAGLAALLDRRAADLPLRGRLVGTWVVLGGLRRAWPLLRRALPGGLARFVRSFGARPPTLAVDGPWFEAWGRGWAAEVEDAETTAEGVRAALTRVDIAEVFASMAPHMTGFLAAIVARRWLARLVPGADDDLDALGRGFEAEVVTRPNQGLGDLADRARSTPEVAAALESGATLDDLDSVDGGPAFSEAFAAFLDAFGHRATGEIDLSRPRWRDDPTTLLATVRSNLASDAPGGHREHLRRLVDDAEAAAEWLESRAARGPLGPVRRRLVRRLVWTYRAGAPLREYPKQGIAHRFAAIHDVVVEAGDELAADGRLEEPADVWLLRVPELLAALEADAAIEADLGVRREACERAAALTPPPLVTSEGERPSARLALDRTEDGTLVGTPVSAGVVEGPARVVLDPASASVEPGDVLVAPATDPGWTPLFLNVSGLVMEVGGRMTHGALVAREYGIPAVASVAGATTAIRTGDRLRVDGSRGTVERLDGSGTGVGSEERSRSP